MVRFIHSADWQLGMTRAWLTPEAQARFSQARIEAITRIGSVAREKHAEFIVVAGDVYDANWVEPTTVARSLDALRNVPVPVFLLPGNHDAYDASSIYRQPDFLAHKPPNVTVLHDPGVTTVKPGVEIAAAPWLSKRATTNPVTTLLPSLEPTGVAVRILLAHGGIDATSPDPDNPLLVRMADLDEALRADRIHYVALGDRHSATRIDPAGRVWYSGAPEPTAYVETNQRKTLFVDLTRHECKTEELEVGTWRFIRESRALAGDADLDAFTTWAEALPSKATTTLKLGLQGTLSLRGRAKLGAQLERMRTLMGGLETWDDENRLAIAPDQADLDALRLTGFAQAALEELKTRATQTGADAVLAQDAIGLLWRLCGPGGNP